LFRVMLVSCGFAVCALLRSGVLFLLPGFLLALLLGFRRLLGRDPTEHRGLSKRAQAVAGALLVVLFVVPYLVSNWAYPQRHGAWPAIWEGLGDFDRTKGHTWSDGAAWEAVRNAREEATPMPRTGEQLVAALSGPESQAILRRQVLTHIREDPVWFARILARRLVATVTQAKLWPLTSRDGLWMQRSTSPNEGSIDKYYGYTYTVGNNRLTFIA